MGNESIIYDYEYLKKITDNYQTCMDSLQDAISNCVNAKNSAENEYAGLADEILEATFDKITEHLKLLHICCETTNLYVMESSDEIQKADTRH